jgi:MoaA/NifB/PqqE/SkfB family radical SAM enzyme
MDTSEKMDSKRRAGTLMLHLLGRCNLTCAHCYMDGSPLRREQLPLNGVMSAIEDCEAMGIGTLYLTGGEALLYKGLSEVLKEASQVPGLETTLCTNGILVNEPLASLLASYHTQVNVSVDGDEQFHDEFRRRKGAFRGAVHGIRQLVGRGVPVTIVTTISRRNLHSLPNVTAWAAEVGAVKFRVQPLLKLGRGAEIADQRLSSAQLDRLILDLTDLATTYAPRGLKCSLIGVTRRFLVAHPCGAYVCNGAGCHRRVAKEIKKIVVREDGTVLPEVTNLDHAFAIGHFNDARLPTLVAQYFEDGYSRFDQLCRTTYAEVLPTWTDAIVPWDEIVAARSYTWKPDRLSESCDAVCNSCSPAREKPVQACSI